MTWLHIVAGTIVLAVTPVALFVRLGGRWHRRIGTVFAVAMAIVLFSALFMWQKQGHQFLFALAFVSAYLVYHGFRIVERRRRKVADQLDDRVDLVAAGVAVVSGIWLFVLAAHAATDEMRSLVPVLFGLGAIAIAFALNDVRGVVVGRRMQIGWLLAHLSAMLSAYISGVTAFVVINAHGVPMLLRWAVPIGLGTSVIVGYSIRYRLAAAAAKRRAVPLGSRGVGSRMLRQAQPDLLAQHDTLS